jgi:hypothetical protein
MQPTKMPKAELRRCFEVGKVRVLMELVGKPSTAERSADLPSASW